MKGKTDLKISNNPKQKSDEKIYHKMRISRVKRERFYVDVYVHFHKGKLLKSWDLQIQL